MRQLDLISLFLDAIGNVPFGIVALKVTLVLGLATAACALLHRQSAAIRHRIWVLALGVTLALPLAPLLPQFELRVLPGVVDSNSQELAVGQRVAQAPPRIAPAEIALSESKAGPGQNDSPPTGTETGSSTAKSATGSLPNSIIQTSPARSAKSHGIGHLLVFTWLLGTTSASLLFVVSLAIQTIQLSRLRRVNDDEWADSTNEAAKRLGLQRPIMTLESNQACVPAVVGILSPRLVIPHDWRTWSLAQRNCILLHELAHVKRFDVSTQFIGRLALLAYWFHPLVWFAVRQLRAERELASDDCVLLAGPAASDYAEELLRTLRCYRPVRPALGVAMAHSARIDQRVLAILDAQRCRNPLGKTTAFALLCFFGVLSGVLGGVTLASRLAKAEQPEQAAEAAHTEAESTDDVLIYDDGGKTFEFKKEPDGKSDKNDEKKPLTAKELTGKWFGEGENKDGIRKLVATMDFDIKIGGDVKWRLRYETEESNGAEIGIHGLRIENAATGRVELHFKKTVLGHLARGEGDTILLTILPEFENKNMPGEKVYRRFEGLVLRREK